MSARGASSTLAKPNNSMEIDGGTRVRFIYFLKKIYSECKKYKNRSIQYLQIICHCNTVIIAVTYYYQSGIICWYHNIMS